MEPLKWLMDTISNQFSEPTENAFLEQENYVDLLTSRGLNYHYYYSSPTDKTKPFLLFLHGFPSTSYDWRHQILFFEKQGYGLIVPDMLGYGGTDKPTTPEYYKPSLICGDIIEIMNNENVDKAIAIGHDWGSKITSRLANYYPDRFTAFAFLAVPYLPPQPDFNLHAILENTKSQLGYELYGYWVFMSQEGADRMMEHRFDSFFSLVWPGNPDLWKTDMAPLGGLKAWLLANKKGPLPPYLTEDDKRIMKSMLLKGGFAGAVNWYRVMTTNIAAEDDRKLPRENYRVPHPVFFGGATRDYISLSAAGKKTISEHCPNLTVREFDADHWLILSHPGQVCRELWHWITEIEGAAWVGDDTQMVVTFPEPASPMPPRNKDKDSERKKEKKHKRDMTEEERRERKERKERKRREKEERALRESGMEVEMQEVRTPARSPELEPRELHSPIITVSET